MCHLYIIVSKQHYLEILVDLGQPGCQENDIIQVVRCGDLFI